MKSQYGVTLVEMLFVIAIIAVIIMVSVMYYKSYQKRENLALIRQDVQVIYQALNDYYHAQGCDQQGDFSGALNSDLINVLNLQDFLKAADPRPLITHYHAKIVLQQQVKHRRPLYEFEISAELAKDLPDSQQHWLQQALNAKAVSNAQLTWTSLPANSHSQGEDAYWPLNGFGRLLRKNSNDNTLLRSPSYCEQ